MNRRAFMLRTAAAVGLAGCRPRPAGGEEGVVMTVDGPVRPERLGTVLPHEHVLVDFIGADRASPARYDPQEVFRVALPQLQRLRALGAGTLVEATPAYLGRDPLLLRRLSRASGLHLVTNTGYYGARQDVHLPPHAFTDTADELAARWEREWREGIDGTGVRPGFMKIGVDGGRLSEIDRKLVRAAARAHLRTGLTIAVHTGPAAAAFDELDVLAEEGVHPSAWIWVHAQGEPDPERHAEAARRGAWVEFDGVSPESADRHVELVLEMKRRGLLHRVLVSHDAGWYHVGEPGGGAFRPYDALFTRFLPALERAGLTTEERRRLLVANPADALAVRVRR